MNIEPHLRRALAPVPAPKGFADRVMARVGAEGRPGRFLGRPRALGRPMSRAWLALAASLAVAATGGVGYLQHARRVEGERAKAQVIEALEVTRAVLDAVQRSVADRPAQAPARN
jgi:hypothetical protein